MLGNVVHNCHTYRPSSEFFLLIANSMDEVPALNLLAISAIEIPILGCPSSLRQPCSRKILITGVLPILPRCQKRGTSEKRDVNAERASQEVWGGTDLGRQGWGAGDSCRNGLDEDIGLARYVPYERPYSSIALGPGCFIRQNDYGTSILK